MSMLAPASETKGTGKDRRLTGRHVLLMFAGFFGFIFIINVFLLYQAFSTFRGLEVDSSYRAGRAFPKEIEAARAQEERGWKVAFTAERGGDGAAILRFSPRDRNDTPVSGLVVRAEVHHPVDRKRDILTPLGEERPGFYQIAVPGLSAGQWSMTLEARKGGERLFRTIERVTLP